VPEATPRKARLKLADVRRAFRLIGEVRERSADADAWRPHMVRRLCGLLNAEIVVSSEVHFCATAAGTFHVTDVGWGCEDGGDVWRIHTDQVGERPENYWVIAAAAAGAAPGTPEQFLPVKPVRPGRSGKSFILSQYSLPHGGTVDQIGAHRALGDPPFTPAEYRLLRLFHVELGRLWKRDVLRRAKDPATDLPPRLAQTLDALATGLSEKQVALKLDLSRHTIHNYVKALHQRFCVNSRAELVATAMKRARERGGDFVPRFSVETQGAGRPRR